MAGCMLRRYQWFDLCQILVMILLIWAFWRQSTATVLSKDAKPGQNVKIMIA